MAGLLLGASATAPSPAAAQRTLGYDTISGESPVAVTCGFCAGEKFGVIYRDLPAPARGLEAGDFPIELEALQLALAAADAVGSGATFTCSGSTTGGVAMVGIAIYAGTDLPSDILDLDATDPWPGETLVWGQPDVPIMRSVADEEGSASYEVNFNRLLLQDEAGLPYLVNAPNVYIRVVVSLNPDTALSSSSCDSLSLETPGGFAVRDNDGVVNAERNLIYADGLGWFWNEAIPGGSIGGDWAMRLEVRDLGEGPVVDSGTPMADSGVDSGSSVPDAGSADTGPGEDDASSDGGCEAAGPNAGGGPNALLFAAVLLWLGRRRGV
ncbi:MAG: hypothetical protein DRJ42_16330 [Deltaproteobacteria bacterium]|nr:MAG: hypothetical protein DRJ42_16330 [Deltaproteobacteria bacterium]